MRSKEILGERKEGEGRIEQSSLGGFYKGNCSIKLLSKLLPSVPAEVGILPSAISQPSLYRDVQNAQADPGEVEYFCGGSSSEWFLLPQP